MMLSIVILTIICLAICFVEAFLRKDWINPALMALYVVIWFCIAVFKVDLIG